jgi:hypothetical protein
MMLSQIPLANMSQYAGLLTTVQAEALRGNTYLPDSYFNPIQDANGNWIVSAEEIAYCANPNFLWVKELAMIPLVAPPSRLINGEVLP